jgi:hypothetical protein
LDHSTAAIAVLLPALAIALTALAIGFGHWQLSIIYALSAAILLINMRALRWAMRHYFAPERGSAKD